MGLKADRQTMIEVESGAANRENELTGNLVIICLKVSPRDRTCTKCRRAQERRGRGRALEPPRGAERGRNGREEKENGAQSASQEC